MARLKVTHSADACCIHIKGDKRNPEPTTAVIKFPGGNVEVSRASDGTYWAHLTVSNGESEQGEGATVGSRVEYKYEKREHDILPVPDVDHVRKVALRIKQIKPDLD